jgi:hypothetical protein
MYDKNSQYFIRDQFKKKRTFLFRYDHLINTFIEYNGKKKQEYNIFKYLILATKKRQR